MFRSSRIYRVRGRAELDCGFRPDFRMLKLGEDQDAPLSAANEKAMTAADNRMSAAITSTAFMSISMFRSLSRILTGTIPFESCSAPA